MYYHQPKNTDISMLNSSLNPLNFKRKDINLVIESSSINARAEVTVPEIIGSKIVICKTALGNYTLYNVSNSKESFMASYTTPVSNSGYEYSCIVEVDFSTGVISIEQPYIGNATYNANTRNAINTIYYT